MYELRRDSSMDLSGRNKGKPRIPAKHASRAPARAIRRAQSRAVSVEHYENFPVASWLCPPALRPPVRAIYWFARTADDIADEGDAPAAERQSSLAAYRDDLARAAAGQPVSDRWRGVFEPLAESIRAHALPLPLLAALLDAFEEDTRHAGYADRAALLDYCSRSANPIGRLLLHLHGLVDPELQRRSDAAAHATTPAQCLRAPHADASRALVRDLCAWARELMHEGAPIAPAVPGRVGWELRFVVQGGLRILAKIEAMNFASFARRPRLHAVDHLLIGLRALTMRPSLPEPARIA